MFSTEEPPRFVLYWRTTSIKSRMFRERLGNYAPQTAIFLDLDRRIRHRTNTEIIVGKSPWDEVLPRG